jgi:CBS domain-containing protein
MPGSETDRYSPHDLHQQVAAAGSIAALKKISEVLLAAVEHAVCSGIAARDIVEFISAINDAVTLRLIGILEETEGIRLPSGATYLVLGSEGRGDQTLRTDQDNAIAYPDGLPHQQLRCIEQFASRLVDALEEIGVPRCPGNIMVSNPEWRHSMSEWQQLLDRWITTPTPENVLYFGIFRDVRPLHGNLSLGNKLREHIRVSARNCPRFFPHMALHATRFPRALGMFGRIRLERHGENRGKVDIKKAGIFAITVGVSLLALESGVNSGNTWDKLKGLKNSSLLSSGDIKTVEDAFNCLVQLRLQSQLRELVAGRKPTYFIDPKDLSDRDLRELRGALKGVDVLLYQLRHHYHLDSISM